jgi:hypothetical protein
VLGTQALPPLWQLVRIAGCPPGKEPSGATGGSGSGWLCVDCPSGTFSDGSGCRSCPTAGARCIGGVLQLQQAFYMPQSQRGVAIGPATQLFPCINADACTLNATTQQYGCNAAAGYTGVLCGECSGEYTREESVCIACWPTWAAGLALAAVCTLALAAARCLTSCQQSCVWSPSAISLRQLLDFLQTLSLLLTLGGSSSAGTLLRRLLNWTNAANASLLQVGPLGCLFPPAFPGRYFLTLLLPLIFTLACGLVSLLSTTSRIRSAWERTRYPTSSLLVKHPEQQAGATALQARATTPTEAVRLSSLLLMLVSMLYMPLLSASLRALDCYERPIDGVTYLRADLGLACDSAGQRAAAGLAWLMLVGLGCVLPVALCLQFAHLSRGGVKLQLLSRSRPEVPPAGSEKEVPLRGPTGSGALPGRHTQPGEDAAQITANPIAAAELRRRGSIVAGPQGPAARASRLLQSPALSTELAARNAKRGISGCAWLALAVGYRPGFAWWEAVVMLRKLAGALIVALSSSPIAGGVGLCMVLAAGLLLQESVQPYAAPLQNLGERLSLSGALALGLLAILAFLLAADAASTSASDNGTPQNAQASIAAVMLMMTLALALSLAAILIHELVPRHRLRELTSGYITRKLRRSLCSCRGGVDNSATTTTSAAARRQSLLAIAQVQSFRGNTGAQLQPARRRASRGASVVQGNPAPLVSARPRALLTPAAAGFNTRSLPDAQGFPDSAPTVNPLLALQRNSRGTIARVAPVARGAGRTSRQIAVASSRMLFSLPPTRHSFVVSAVPAPGLAASPNTLHQYPEATSASDALVRLARGSGAALSFAAEGSQQRALPLRSRVLLPPPAC